VGGLVEVRIYTRCVQNGCCRVDAGKLLDLDLHSRDRVHRDIRFRQCCTIIRLACLVCLQDYTQVNTVQRFPK
jgi:hypothetical protein